jgi:hypothetical protein
VFEGWDGPSESSRTKGQTETGETKGKLEKLFKI